MNDEEINFLNDFIQNQIEDVPFSLEDNLQEYGKKFNHHNLFKQFCNLVDDFCNNNTLNRYIVLSGLRGAGKTTILFQILEYLIKNKNINQNQILYLSCENLNSIVDIDIYKTIEFYIKEFHNTSLRLLKKNVFILIDEAHYDKNWSLAGKMIYDQSKKIFMIFTGSSAIKFNYNADASRRMLKFYINPLNYSQHLKLKYNYDTQDFSRDLVDLLFQGQLNDICDKEYKITADLLNLKEYTSNEWDFYFKFGALPFTMREENPKIAFEKLYSSIEDIITKDLSSIKTITTTTQNYARRIIGFLSKKYPGDISQESLANTIGCSFSSVNNLINLLEQSGLIFHTLPYAGPNAQSKKSWQYYFATPSMRHAINLKHGFSSLNKNEYEGILLENLIASNLFNLKNNNEFFDFNIYFDSKKQGVDFLVKKEFGDVIPIEVGHGIKTKRQINKAINRYNSPHGIIISNTTNKIKKEDDVIYIPYKTFSFI